MGVFLGLLGSAIYLVIFYYIIKAAVKDGVTEAYKKIEQEKNKQY